MNQLPCMQWRGLLLMLFIAVLLPVNTAFVHAQTVTEIMVNSTEDRVDADLVDDICLFQHQHKRNGHADVDLDTPDALA